MNYLKVFKNSNQNALNQFYPSIFQRWKIMQMFVGSWLLPPIDSPFYCRCQQFMWPPPRYSHRALYWGIDLGSIEISIAKASDYLVLTNLSSILPWKLWDSFRYSRTSFCFSDTSLRMFLMSVGPCGIRHTPMPPGSCLSCHFIWQSQYPYANFPYLPLCFFPCCQLSYKSINHSTLYPTTDHLWIGPVNQALRCLAPV